MLRAGRAAFATLLDTWPDAGSVTICCGKGNNAGDGYVLAGLARELGLGVQLVQVGDADALAGDAAVARDWARARGVTQLDSPPCELRGAVVVDALLGTGARGELRSEFAALVDAINASGRGVLALDVPTGVQADTGEVASVAVRAAVTTTFIGRKFGLFTGPGVSYAGRVRFADLGVPPDVLAAVPGCPLLRWSELPPLPGRDPNAYKQSQGHVVVVGPCH